MTVKKSRTVKLRTNTKRPISNQPVQWRVTFFRGDEIGQGIVSATSHGAAMRIAYTKWPSIQGYEQHHAQRI